MDIDNLLRVAYNAIVRNKMRSILTMLGIIIGVGSIIAMNAVGEGAQETIDQQTEAFGTNVITIRRGGVTASGKRLKDNSSLTVEDADAILDNCDLVTAQTPAFRHITTISTKTDWGTQVFGVNPDFVNIRQWGIAAGSMFSKQDVRSGNKICILGSTVSTTLFGSRDPTGEIVRIQKIPFRVMGVLEEKGQLATGQDQDDLVLIPYTTFQKRILNESDVRYIYVSVRTAEDITPAIQQITSLLRSRHRLSPETDDDFTIKSQEEVNALAKSISQTVSLLMVVVASISLVVGGIGIMNIMLVSVTERTREIGIRMAIGATEKDILLQFLIESVFISLFGGIIGIIGGGITANIVESATSWPVNITLISIVVAASFSGAVGVFFGFYPARKAAQLNPIDALRFE